MSRPPVRGRFAVTTELGLLGIGDTPSARSATSAARPGGTHTFVVTDASSPPTTVDLPPNVMRREETPAGLNAYAVTCRSTACGCPGYGYTRTRAAPPGRVQPSAYRPVVDQSTRHGVAGRTRNALRLFVTTSPARWKRVSPTACRTYPGRVRFARPVRSNRSASFGNVVGVHSNSRGTPATAVAERFQNSASHQYASFDANSPALTGNGTSVTLAVGPTARSTHERIPLGSSVSGRPAVPSIRTRRANAYAVSANASTSAHAARTTAARRPSSSTASATSAAVSSAATTSTTRAPVNPPSSRCR